jgi:hypothetical protein
MLNFLFIVTNLASAVMLAGSPWIQGLNCFVAGMCFVGLLNDMFEGSQ